MKSELQITTKSAAFAVIILVLLIAWSIFALYKTLPEAITLLTQGQSDCNKGLVYEYQNVSNCLDGGSVASLVFTTAIDLIGTVLLLVFGAKLLGLIGLKLKVRYIIALLLLGFVATTAAGFKHSIDTIQNLAYVTEMQEYNKLKDQAEVKTHYDDSYYIVSIILDPNTKAISVKAPQCFLDSDQFKLQVLPSLNNLNGLSPSNPRVVDALSLANTERIQRMSNQACNTTR